MISVACRMDLIEPAPLVLIPVPCILVYAQYPFLYNGLSCSIVIQYYGAAFTTGDVLYWIEAETGDAAEGSYEPAIILGTEGVGCVFDDTYIIVPAHS